MGEAKRRKLAGTYPKQDGGPWGTMPPAVLAALNPEGRRQLDAVIIDCIDAADLRDVLMESITARPDVVDVREAVTQDEKLRHMAYELIRAGLLLLWVRPRPDGREGLVFRLEPVMPPDPTEKPNA
jgi:hypothetical protein